MKAAHTSKTDELHHKIEEGQEESRRAHEESQWAQAEVKELLLRLLAGRNR
jgi:hypothetical protein